ncbi:hydroxyacid dehydrogenase [Alteribacillus iranensis]|uniref:D-3-phosphoglycerate dehydrogenase n=1 Tax=Alteribacillus iranensis TaxID=930128 RepID=A0A1I2BCK3_9BACI|nr:hydroxyacid dehydrogenase [Alteribacillus iranensis]SFE53789.1 D-3-phosphoglycerate dehydrogenase [Alteribacillus iranensis]
MLVYLNENIHPEAITELKKHAKITNDHMNTEIDAIIVRTEPVTREMMEHSKNLKVIGKHGIGYDNIDIDAAHDLGISVVYTPTANSQSVAELIITLLLNVTRNIIPNHRRLVQGETQTNAPNDLIGNELLGKKMGFIGLGNVALLTGDILRKGFSVDLLGYDPYVTTEKAASHGITKTESLQEMLPEVDFINVSVPLTESTKNIISMRELKMCKKSAILINTSRGGTVNERDLYVALSNNILKAAASDVFNIEPPRKDHPLLSLDNFIATPHIGASTDEAMYRMGKTVVQEVISVLNGKKASYQVI